jgi:hypothetical protein
MAKFIPFAEVFTPQSERPWSVGIPAISWSIVSYPRS